MKILDIALKDITRSYRSIFAVGMSILAPLLLIGLVYFAFGGASGGGSELPAITVGLVDADRLSTKAMLGHPLGEDIRGMFFDESVKSWITARDYPDAASARLDLDKQEIDVAVIVPEDFTERYLAGERGSPVHILSDPTLVIAPQVVQNMVTAMLDGAAGGKIAIETIEQRRQINRLRSEPAQFQELIDRYTNWYADFQRDMFHNPGRAALVALPPNTEGRAKNAMRDMLGPLMAGQMVFFAFFTGAFSMMSIIREDEEGTLARLFTTPIKRTSILAGKFIAVFLSVIVQGLVLIIAVHYAFGITWGNPLAVILVLIGQVIAAVGLGVLLISFVKTSQQGGPVLGGGLTALGMIGGLFTSGMSMPEGFTMLAVLTPQGWVIKAWKVLLSGQPLPELAAPLLVMAVMGIAAFIIGASIFRKRYA